MPNLKSAWKRMRTSEKNRQRNKSCKSQIKTIEKKLRDAAEGSDKDAAALILKDMFSKLDKAAKGGIIANNKRNRKKSQLASLVAKIAKTDAPAV